MKKARVEGKISNNGTYLRSDKRAFYFIGDMTFGVLYK